MIATVDMYKFPKTERGIRSRISTYRKSLSTEKRKYGVYDDGYGNRYILFWLHFVLGDLKAAQNYIRWFEKNFEDDAGEPVSLLCNSLLHYRLGKIKKARYLLADLMLTNLYLIPIAVGKNVERNTQRFLSSFSDYEYVDELPIEVRNSITEEEKQWSIELYESMEFRRYRKRHIEIYKQLEVTDDIDSRSILLIEASGLLDGLKANCS